MLRMVLPWYHQHHPNDITVPLWHCHDAAEHRHWHQSASQHHQHHHSAAPVHWCYDGTTMVLPQSHGSGKAPTKPGASRIAGEHSVQPKDQDKLDGRCSAVTSIETNGGDLLQGSARAGAQLPPHRCSSAAGAPTNTPLNQAPALLPIPAFPPGLPPGHST